MASKLHIIRLLKAGEYGELMYPSLRRLRGCCALGRRWWCKNVWHIKSINIRDMRGVVENSKIVAYRAIAKITFEVESGDL